MTEFDKLTVTDVEAIGAADDPDAMDRNARGATNLWSAYEYAKTSFASHFTELRRYWSGAAAERFAAEADIVGEDVSQMGSVLQAHSDALPMVAATMRDLKTESKRLADEYRTKRAEFDGQPAETARPQIERLDQEYGEKSRAKLIEANDTYHQYNNGYLEPPRKFRGVVADDAQPRLQSAPSYAPVQPAQGPNPVTVANAPAPSPYLPVTAPVPRPVVMPPPPASRSLVGPRSLVGTPGMGTVRNPPTPMPRSTMVSVPQAAQRVGVAPTVPAHPRTAVVRPVTPVATGPRPGVVVRPPVTARPVTPTVAGHTVTTAATGQANAMAPRTGTTGRAAVAAGPVRAVTATGHTTATGRHPQAPVLGRRGLTSSAIAAGRASTVVPAAEPPPRRWTRSPLPRGATGSAEPAASATESAVDRRRGPLPRGAGSAKPASPATEPIPGQARGSLPRGATGSVESAASATEPAVDRRRGSLPRGVGSAKPASAATEPIPGQSRATTPTTTPATEPGPRWTRSPIVPPKPAAAVPPPTPEPPRTAFTRTPWVRPADGSAVYPARIATPKPTPRPSEVDEPLLNPVTLSRLLSEATPAERERLLAIETAKLERIRAAKDDTARQ